MRQKVDERPKHEKTPPGARLSFDSSTWVDYSFHGSK